MSELLRAAVRARLADVVNKLTISSSDVPAKRFRPRLADAWFAASSCVIGRPPPPKT